MEAMTIERQMEAIAIVTRFNEGATARSTYPGRTLEVGGLISLSMIELSKLSKKGYHFSLYTDDETKEWSTIKIHIF